MCFSFVALHEKKRTKIRKYLLKCSTFCYLTEQCSKRLWEYFMKTDKNLMFVSVFFLFPPDCDKTHETSYVVAVVVASAVIESLGMANKLRRLACGKLNCLMSDFFVLLRN